jgi:hypothetical protein
MRSALVLMLVVALSGCTGLGYVPRYVEPDSMTPRTDPLRPGLTDVKELAYRQVNGYLVSGRINKDALYAGALTAGIGIAAMAALGIFAPASPALQAIPIGGGLIAGTAAVMQNEPKATIYMRAALLVLIAVGRSDERMVWHATTSDDEALCLRRDLGEIDSRVTEHLLLLNPQHVSDRLRAIGSANAAELQKLAADVGNYEDLKTLKSACGDPIPPALRPRVVLPPPPLPAAAPR